MTQVTTIIMMTADLWKSLNILKLVLETWRKGTFCLYGVSTGEECKGSTQVTNAACFATVSPCAVVHT